MRSISSKISLILTFLEVQVVLVKALAAFEDDGEEDDLEDEDASVELLVVA